MSQAIQTLRLTPQAAGTLQQQHTKATKELRALTRYNKELDHQLVSHKNNYKRSKIVVSGICSGPYTPNFTDIQEKSSKNRSQEGA